jgi:putative phosphoesterase
VRRVAALCDVHGNLAALEAVLAEIEVEGVDAIVVGGDAVSGPLPRETLVRLLTHGERTAFVRGNADRILVEVRRGERDAGAGPTDAWVAAQLTDEQVEFLAGLPTTVTLEIDGLGPVEFCHATPRDDEEIFLETTADEVAEPMLAGAAPVVVCGHTHMQFDRRIAGTRVVNAGSVGMPYEGAPGAYWALLGPDVELRRTEYDVDAAAARMREGDEPDVDRILELLLRPPSRQEAIEHAESVRFSG